MPVVKLRCSEHLLRTMLRLDDLNAEIVGARMATDIGGSPVIEFEVDAPGAPDGTTQMHPIVKQDHDSGRVTMLDPGWRSG
jgi:hypothetical protein